MHRPHNAYSLINNCWINNCYLHTHRITLCYQQYKTFFFFFFWLCFPVNIKRRIRDKLYVDRKNNGPKRCMWVPLYLIAGRHILGRTMAGGVMTEEQQLLSYPLHECVFEGDVQEFARLMRTEDLSRKDKHGTYSVTLRTVMINVCYNKAQFAIYFIQIVMQTGSPGVWFIYKSNII